MTKVITYGTFDLLHYGHIRLLERAKKLGDYLIVGVTSDDFDKSRGKINVKQSLAERIAAVQATGIADEIIVEEYEGQKIDDIIRLGIDVFTVGSDWAGVFDYLNAYCKVVYLDRTAGVSSSDIRSRRDEISIGIAGDLNVVKKFADESRFVNGVRIGGVFSNRSSLRRSFESAGIYLADSFQDLLGKVDAVFLVTPQDQHFEQIKLAIENHKHVLCVPPFALNKKECSDLFEMATRNGVILMNAIKTAYFTAYMRLILLVKSGKIGDVVSIKSTCTSLAENDTYAKNWNSICAWGPTAMLPIFQLLGCEYAKKVIVSSMSSPVYDEFTKIDFVFKHSVASVEVGKGVKSEGELVVAGTKGYIFVPSPWWKTDYFEIRFEEEGKRTRYYYQLDGEGLRYELIYFLQAIQSGKQSSLIDKNTSIAICDVIDAFYNKADFIDIGYR